MEGDDRMEMIEEMLLIVQAQERCLSGDEVDLEQLEALIDQRQKIMDGMKLQQRVEMKPSNRTMIEELVRLDRNNQEVLQRRMGEVRSQIGRVQKDKQFSKNYGCQGRHDQSAFLDKNI